MGMIVPTMGTKARTRMGIADVLFSPVEARVLALLFGQPDRSFQSAELIRLADSGTGGTHRVLTRLASAGLVTVSRAGNQKHYQANRSAPVFHELHRLVIKTVGVADPLRRALAPAAGDIRAAFVYGSVADGSATAASDVDLMVLSDTLTHAEVFEWLRPVEAMLARTVNATVMAPDEWSRMRADRDSFASRVAERPRLWLVGAEDDFA
jgi:predicted nucleotidyltransferase